MRALNLLKLTKRVTRVLRRLALVVKRVEPVAKPLMKKGSKLSTASSVSHKRIVTRSSYKAPNSEILLLILEKYYTQMKEDEKK